MNKINALIEAGKKIVQYSEDRPGRTSFSDAEVREILDLSEAATKTLVLALPEIVELVEFAKAIIKLDDVAEFLDVEETFGVNLDRIREICDE